MRKIWDWYYGTATIRKKLVISYLILVLLPILILGVYSYYISKRSLLEQTRSTMEGNMSSIVHSMERNIQRENDNIKYLSYNVSCRADVLVFYNERRQYKSNRDLLSICRACYRKFP